LQKLLHQTPQVLDFILNVSHILLKRHVDNTRGLVLGLQLKGELMMACMHPLGLLSLSLFLGFHLCLKVTIRSHLKIPFKCLIFQSQCEDAIVAIMHLFLHLMGIGTGVGVVLMVIITVTGLARGQSKSKWWIDLHLPLHPQFHHQNGPPLNPLDKSLKCLILQSQCEDAIVAIMHLFLHLMRIGTGVRVVLMMIITVTGLTRGQSKSKWWINLCLPLHPQFHHQNSPPLNPLDKSLRCLILQSQCKDAIMAIMHLFLHLMRIGTGVRSVLIMITGTGLARGQSKSKWWIDLHLPLHLQFHHQNGPLLNPLDNSLPFLHPHHQTYQIHSGIKSSMRRI
jgi:hypothetical protein